jgi:uncharacterized repeat protein (TIGR02543 family)
MKKHTATRLAAPLAALLLSLSLRAATATETVLDRHGDWMLVQTEGDGTKTIALADADGGGRTLLSSMAFPAETVTNVYWDAYAVWVPEMNGYVGEVVTNVSRVGADYEFRAFLNDGCAYWEDWADGTQRLWTVSCSAPAGKTLLASFRHEKTADAPRASFFLATPFGRGAIWEEPAEGMNSGGSGLGKVVVYTNGTASVVASNTYFAIRFRNEFNDFSEIDRTDRFFYLEGRKTRPYYMEEDSFGKKGMYLLTPSGRQSVWQILDSFSSSYIPTWPTGRGVLETPPLPHWTESGIVRGDASAALEPPGSLVLDAAEPSGRWVAADGGGNAAFSVAAHSTAGGEVSCAWTLDGMAAGGGSTFATHVGDGAVHSVRCRVFGSGGEDPLDFSWVAGRAADLAACRPAVTELDRGLYELVPSGLPLDADIAWTDADSGRLVGTSRTLRVATFFGTNRYSAAAGGEAAALPDLRGMPGRQRWPWTSDVDLEWAAGGLLEASLFPGSSIRIVPSLRETASGLDLPAATFRDAETGIAASAFDIPVGSTGRIVWAAGSDLSADYRTDDASAVASGIFRAGYLVCFDYYSPYNWDETTLEYKDGYPIADPLPFAAGEAKALPQPNYSTSRGASFLGWATNPGDAAVYAAGEVVSNLSEKAGIVRLYSAWTPVVFTVRFNANGGKGTMADQTFTRGFPQALRANAFTRDGHVFTGWSECVGCEEFSFYPDGSDGSSLGSYHGQLVDIYACWKAIPCEVRFDANGGTGTMAPQAFPGDEPQALRTNAFSRTGWTFAGWAETAGGPPAFADGEILVNPAPGGQSTTLYAVWTPNAYTVRFDPNGGAGAMDGQAFVYDTPQALRTNAFILASAAFLGWAETPDGPAVHADGAVVSNLTAEADDTVVLHAVWRRTYRVVFDANGGEGVMPPQDIDLGKAAPLAPNAFVRKGYSFAGWALSADGEVAHADGAAVENLSDELGGIAVLFARWTPNTYTVHFDANGGTGTMPDRTFAYRGGGTLPANAFEKEGFQFMGWALSPGGFAVHADGAPADAFATEPGATVTLYAEWGGTYLVVDLAEGPEASTYPVTRLSVPPGGDWTEDFKTTKLVLRRIEPGTFEMGAGTGGQVCRNVHITHPFYIGVFEVTQMQWELVTDGNPSEYAGSTRPVECVSYNNIRGTLSGTNWPSGDAVDRSSFLGKLRARTGLAFDLPTEVQWEYACRSGTTGDLNSGEDLSGETKCAAMNDVGRYWSNGGENRQHARAGLYAPNAWGLYDMHGNVAEWCLDWYGAVSSAPVVDPSGPLAGTERLRRGGSWASTAGSCRSAARDRALPGTGNDSSGFRLAFSAKSGVGVLRFDGNGGQGSMDAQTVLRGEPVALAPCTFTRSGWQFGGWGVSPDGPAIYEDGETVADLQTDVLYAVWIPCCTVRFRSNGGTGSMPDLPVVAGSGQTLPPNAFSRQGHFFAGWSRSPDGPVECRNADLVPDFQVAAGDTVDLHAVWQGYAYVVRFSANGGIGTMENQGFVYGSTQALRPNAFSKRGHAFAGWAESPDGAVAYGDGQSVLNLTDASGGLVTLYAKWTPVSHVVCFDANGGTGEMPAQSFVYDIPEALVANAFYRTGYIFAGWTESPEGAVAYGDGQSVLNLTDEPGCTVTLYAKWTPISYQVQFDANGGEGTMDEQGFVYGNAQALRSNAFSKRGYVFAGWAESSEGAVVYGDGQSVLNLTDAPGGLVTLYAKWTPTYTIRFDANGGKGTMEDLQVVWDTETTLLPNAFARETHVFAGWATNATSSSRYPDGATIYNLAETPHEIVTLYAVWVEEGLVPYLVVDLSAGSGDGAVYPVSYLDVEPQGGWGDEYKTTKMVLRRINPGTFTMGCEISEVGYYGCEAIPHEVTVLQPFYIGVFEMTQKQYELVMGSNPSYYKGDMRPIACVSYNNIRGSLTGAGWPASSDVDATSFMGKLRAKASGYSWDLPTEAQWEYACRAGTKTALNSGTNLTSIFQDSAMDEVGRYGYNNGYQGGTQDDKGGYASNYTTVGSYLPNAWGLYDMHGNVWEWTLDWYQDRSVFTGNATTDPVGPAVGSYRVIRGGSWDNSARACRSAYRDRSDPAVSHHTAGFRLACVLGL